MCQFGWGGAGSTPGVRRERGYVEAGWNMGAWRREWGHEIGGQGMWGGYSTGKNLMQGVNTEKFTWERNSHRG